MTKTIQALITAAFIIMAGPSYATELQIKSYIYGVFDGNVGTIYVESRDIGVFVRIAMKEDNRYWCLIKASSMADAESIRNLAKSSERLQCVQDDRAPIYSWPAKSYTFQ